MLHASCTSSKLLFAVLLLVVSAPLRAVAIEPQEYKRTLGFAELAFARMMFSARFAGDMASPNRSAVKYEQPATNGQDTIFPTSEWLLGFHLYESPPKSGIQSAALEAPIERFPRTTYSSTESQSLRNWARSLAELPPRLSFDPTKVPRTDSGKTILIATFAPPPLDSFHLASLLNDNARGFPAWRRGEWRNGITAAYFLQAASDFRSGRIHRALVLMSDSLSDYRRGNAVARDLQRFFTLVTKRDLADAAGRNINTLVEDYRRIDACLISHAAVLKKAGLDDAATYTLNRVELEYRLVLRPIIERARAYSESYAFRIPTIDEAAEASLRDTIRDYGQFDSGWVGDASLLELAKTSAEPAKYTEALEVIRSLREAADGRRAPKVSNDEKPPQFTAVLAAVNHSIRPFGRWLEDRTLVHEFCGYFNGSGLDDAGGFGGSLPRLVAEQVFSPMTPVLLDKNVQAGLLEWIATGDAAAAATVGGPAIAYGILGWYFMDTGRPGLAQRAFVDGAYACLYEARPKNLADLATELNGYRLLVTAAGLGKTPRGALRVPPHLFDDVKILLAAWRANWIKMGGDPKVAQTELASLNEIANAKVRFLESSLPSTRDIRFFLPDYRLRDGFIPEHIVDQLMTEKYRAVRQLSDDDDCYYGVLLALDEIIRGCRLPLKAVNETSAN